MTNKLLKYTLLFILCISVHNIVAQNEIAHVYGQLKDEETKKKLDGCMVQVFKDGGVFDNFDAGTTGKYDFKLPLGFIYDIKFSKTDYLSKIIRIDTRNIPEEERYGGFDMNVDGTLFPHREGFNTDLLKEPLARASYNPQGDGLEFDFSYSDKKRKEIEAEFKRLTDIEKNFSKLKADFDELVKDGDQAMIEKKYADAVGKYKSALAIFPKEEPVKLKMADAQSKLDAENANKDFEAQYKKILEEGDAFFKDRKYAESKKKFTKAKEMKNGTYEKEMLYKIDLAMADAENRAAYDAIVADADKKFTNKDFAVCIERYKEASKMYPTESHPKDQILKAEAALKDMLAYEAERLRIQKEYDDKLTLALRSISEDKLEQAITHYRAALVLKSAEEFPKVKILELEALIAERKLQSEQNNADALANEEKARIEKEYNDLIAQADELFIKEQLLDSKSKYEAALVVKADALYPKSKIETIDLLLAQAEELKALDASKAQQDSLDALNLAALNESNARMAELLEQERLEAERRRAEQEEMRLAEEAKLKAKKRNWDSNVDEKAEDQVEKYYREAAAKEYAAKTNKIKQDVDNQMSFYMRKGKDADALIAKNEQDISDQKNKIDELNIIGTSIYGASVADNERKKKNVKTGNEGYQQSSENRIIENEKEIEEKKEALNSVTQNDRYRKDKIEESVDMKERSEKNAGNYQRKGETLLKENQMKAERTKEKQQKAAFEGEKVRKENESMVESRIKDEEIRNNDTRKAADQRIQNSGLKIESKKTDVDAMDDGKDIHTRENANAVEQQKRDAELENLEQEGKSANERYEARKNAFNKNVGEQKDESDYAPVPGTEQLKEGVTENSYKLGNKMVTERIVKIGNKVEKYKKVVSKTAIYFFRNGQSISETTWREATLDDE